MRVPSLLLLLFSRSVVSDSLRLQGLQHARLPCPSPPLRVCSNSCPSLGLSRGKAFWEDSSALGTKKPIETRTWGRRDHGGGRKERKKKWMREEGRAGNTQTSSRWARPGSPTTSCSDPGTQAGHQSGPESLGGKGVGVNFVLTCQGSC